MSLDEKRARGQWAYETFGGLDSGHRSRSSRVVAMAKTLASHPAGTVTEVFDDPADREGAYRLLSNRQVTTEQLTDAMSVATADRCADERRVYVAIDGSSLSLTDRKKVRGIGGVGAWKDHGRGLHVMTALALQDDGTVIGVCAQHWWARHRPSPKRSARRRKLEEKETRFARAALDDAVRRLREHAPETLAVCVMDRGFDCTPVLRTGQDDGAHFIVRAQYDRRLADGPCGERNYLRATLESLPVRGTYQVEVPARAGRPARIATMQIRAARVTLQLPVTRKTRRPYALHAILAREIGGPKDASLSWTLFTTEPIDTFEQIVQIVRAYTFRWRIEEMHRMWKRGGGHVEDTQLRSRSAIEKWATLHCAVAARALRLTQLARTKPEVPATEEFTQAEIDGAIFLRRKRTKRQWGDVPPLGEVVRMIADLGGYTGKSSGGPPGATVIGRGLQRVLLAAEVLEEIRAKIKL